MNDTASQAFISRVAELMDQRQPGVLLNEAVLAHLTAGVEQIRATGRVSERTETDAVSPEGYCFPNTVFETTAEQFIRDESLQDEHFGPVTMFVTCPTPDALFEAVESLHGNLTATVHSEADDAAFTSELFSRLREKAGRLIWNGFPTGVEVVHAMQHGGPYPATTAPQTTSVGMTAIKRFMRPVAFQNLPDSLLPDALQDANPLNIWRIVDNQFTRDPLRRR